MKSRLIAFALLANLAMVSQAYGPDPTVYVTEKGKKYHQKNCRLKHGSTGVKLSVAKKKGFKPCTVCKPPK